MNSRPSRPIESTDEANGPMPNSRPRNPWIAVLCSIVDPGLGFVYNGNVIVGIGVSIASFVLLGLVIWCGLYRSFLPFVISVSVSTMGYVILLSYVGMLAKRLGTVQLRRYNRGSIYVIYFLVGMIAREFILPDWPLKSYSIASSGMSPTLEEGDYVIVNRESYRHASPRAGDLVVFRYPRDPSQTYLKRLVGTEGQTISIREGHVYVDGEIFMPALRVRRNRANLLPSDYADKSIYPRGAGNEDNYGPVAVPHDSLFVLGDFRDNSLDSRYFGFVHVRELLGKALYIYWSRDLSRIGTEFRDGSPP